MEPTEKRKKPYFAPTVQVVEFAVEQGLMGSTETEPEVEIEGLYLGFVPIEGMGNDVYAGNQMTQSDSYFGSVFGDGSHF